VALQDLNKDSVIIKGQESLVRRTENDVVTILSVKKKTKEELYDAFDVF
jgi:hypothetical protein